MFWTAFRSSPVLFGSSGTIIRPDSCTISYITLIGQRTFGTEWFMTVVSGTVQGSHKPIFSLSLTVFLSGIAKFVECPL